jgi:hypothetical protein
MSNTIQFIAQGALRLSGPSGLRKRADRDGPPSRISYLNCANNGHSCPSVIGQ